MDGEGHTAILEGGQRADTGPSVAIRICGRVIQRLKGVETLNVAEQVSYRQVEALSEFTIHRSNCGIILGKIQVALVKQSRNFWKSECAKGTKRD